jgi:hypothetical protein
VEAKREHSESMQDRWERNSMGTNDILLFVLKTQMSVSTKAASSASSIERFEHKMCTFNILNTQQ